MKKALMVALISILLLSSAGYAEIEIIDLGTLGGANSTVGLIPLNNLGQVTGYSTTSNGQTHAFLWTYEQGMQPLYETWGTYSAALSVNDLGQVVGQWQGASTDIRAFLWTAEGGMQDLGTLGGTYARANDINTVGQVTGDSSYSAYSYTHAFLWTAGGVMEDLGTLGGLYSKAVRINETGQVAGWSTTSSNRQHAYLWSSDSGMLDLGSLCGEVPDCYEFSDPYALNDLGQVAGESLTPLGKKHAFLWTNEQDGMQDLGTLGRDTSFVWNLNNNGHVVGNSTTTEGDTHAVLWVTSDGMLEPGGMIDLGTLGGGFSDADDVNDLGQIVGVAENGQGYDRPVLWTPGGKKIIDLGTLEGYDDCTAWAINNYGHIAGECYGDTTRAVLWIIPPPAPEEIVPLILSVQNMIVTGVLGDGAGQSLIAKLMAVNIENPKQATNILTAFTTQVTAFVNAGILTAEDGNALIDAANEIIEQLNT